MLFQKENKEKKREDFLKKSLKDAQRSLENAYTGLQNVSDPDLIDSYIYEVNAANLRYKVLLRDVKTLQENHERLAQSNTSDSRTNSKRLVQKNTTNSLINSKRLVQRNTTNPRTNSKRLVQRNTTNPRTNSKRLVQARFKTRPRVLVSDSHQHS